MKRRRREVGRGGAKINREMGEATNRRKKRASPDNNSAATTGDNYCRGCWCGRYRRYFFRCAAVGQIKQKFPFVTKAQKSDWSRGPGRINRPSVERVSYDSCSGTNVEIVSVAHNEHTHPGQLKWPYISRRNFGGFRQRCRVVKVLSSVRCECIRK